VFHTGVLDSAASFENSPITVNGNMYVSTGHDDVFALDAATGQQKWAYHPADMPQLSQLHICCGLDSRGVAYGDGMIFLARLDATLVALDAQTGQQVWKATVADWQDGYAMTMAPQITNGVVMVGLSGGEFKTRGALVAYDARTGRRLWTFNTTQPGSTWAGNSWQMGGAPVWSTPAVDPGRGLAYLSTGNAAPDLYGADRAGNNLYTASLVALDLRTGKVRWAFQEVHHDIWDYDGPQAPVLFNVTQNGQTQPAVGHCNKDGNYFILNRDTGKPLYPVRETPVSTLPSWQNPSPTQPVSSVQPLVPMKVDPVPAGITAAPEFTPPQEQPLAMQPGPDGGCEWPPGAYSPRTSDVYYNARYLPAVLSSHPGNDTNFGSSAEEPPPGVHPYSILGATNTNTGKVRWSIQAANLNAASMAVGGNLLFYGENNGMFHAVDAATGATRWSFDGTSVANGGGASAPPSIYVANGREYVVEAFGGNRNDRSKTASPVGDTVIAFALPNGSGK
jgi:alcohol dehydrogenase (cytochrome c)